MKNPSTEYCAAAFGKECPPATCRWRCAVEIIDELLGSGDGLLSGEEADLFLDLRWQLARQENAEETLRTFSFLRVKAETSHYLPLFRIRKWLENNIEVHISSAEQRETSIPLSLDNAYCVQALRTRSLCQAAQNGFPILPPPHLRFAFKHTFLTAQKQIAEHVHA